MPRPLRYTLIGLLWAAVAGYIVYSAARVRTHRRQLVVQRLDIEIADSSSHGQLVTGGAVRQWLARSGVKTVGAAAREVDLRSIEGLILRNGFVADATASIDYGGVLRIAVRQRRPVVRLLFDGYGVNISIGWPAQTVQERIDKISARQAAEREKQKKLRKSYEDFLKLLNFVVLVEKDDFWRSEIVQIVVAKGPDGAPEIELVPRTGSHTVIFGSPDDAEEKLAKLLTFYRRGLRNIGWEEYRTINVKYKEQVVCTK